MSIPQGFLLSYSKPNCFCKGSTSLFRVQCIFYSSDLRMAYTRNPPNYLDSNSHLYIMPCRFFLVLPLQRISKILHQHTLSNPDLCKQGYSERMLVSYLLRCPMGVPQCALQYLEYILVCTNLLDSHRKFCSCIFRSSLDLFWLGYSCWVNSI